MWNSFVSTKRFCERRPPANPGSTAQWRPRVRCGEYGRRWVRYAIFKERSAPAGPSRRRRGGASGKRPETDKIPAFYFRIAGRVKGLTSLTRASGRISRFCSPKNQQLWWQAVGMRQTGIADSWGRSVRFCRSGTMIGVSVLRQKALRRT